MNDATPYSLTPHGAASDGYYRAVAEYVDGWLEQAGPQLGSLTNSVAAFLSEQNQPERSFLELAFEALALGVLLREHGNQALQLQPAPAWLLARLVEAQDSVPLPAVEKPVKALRALVSGLTASGAAWTGRQDADGAPAGPDQPADVDEAEFDEGAAALLDRLITWLHAGGMTAQGFRLTDWRDYLKWLDEQHAQAVLARCLLLADDFAENSLVALGQYTEGVEGFLASVAADPMNARWRYDASLVMRARVEYHLGMVGAEILTRAYRQRFRAAPRKIVILPDCLCARSKRAGSGDGIDCQAQLTSLGLKCRGCAPGCRAYQLTRLGEQQGFEVYILPDDLRGVGLGSCRKLVGVGVVGVACALTAWDAGWQVNDAGVPAQGLLLDYPGCRSHWCELGRATDLNVGKLLEIVKG